MKKRLLPFFLSVLIASSVLAGCNSSKDTETTSGSTPTTTTTTSDTPSSEIVSLEISYEKTSYFEGETLNLSSLSVTLTSDNGDQEVVNYLDFESKGLGIKLLNNSRQEVALNNPLTIGQYYLSVYLVAKQNIINEVTITVIEDSLPPAGNESLDGLTDSFTVHDGTYTSSEFRSLKIFDNEFENGTLQATVSYNENGYDNFLVFAYDNFAGSYYSFGFNLKNKVQITYYDGEHLSLVHASEKTINATARLSIELDNSTGSVNYYCDNDFIYGDNIELPATLKYGIYAGAKGCSFSNIVLSDNNTLLDSDFSKYVIASGEFDFENNVITATSTNVLAYHPTKTLKHGEIAVTYNQEHADGNIGMAFCIDNAGKETFWRDADISYYYLVVTINGTVGLYRVKTGAANLLKNINTKEYYLERNHELKVIRDNKNRIHVFLDDVLCFTYVDNHPLKGDKYGVCSTTPGSSYSKIYAKKTFGSDDETISNYSVASGSFYKNGEMIVSNSIDSLIIKNEQAQDNGTIEAEVSMGNNYGTGLVFKLTKPNATSFYEDEESLSYYWVDVKSSNRVIFGKFVSGEVTWTTEKYFPSFMSNGEKMRVVMKDNDLYIYCTNILMFKYHDDDILTGKYYGFRSDTTGAAIRGDITFTAGQNIDTAKYLIFGHSYTQLWHRYKEDFADLGTDIMDIGVGGSQTKNWAEQYVDEVICYNPEWGIYWNGINDVDADIEKDKIMNYYQVCLETIKAAIPNFKCVVISVARCTHEKPMARFEQINALNTDLKAYCDTKDWLVYVEVETIFCDGEGNPLASWFVDNLHPIAAGYKLVAPLVVDAIQHYGE